MSLSLASGRRDTVNHSSKHRRRKRKFYFAYLDGAEHVLSQGTRVGGETRAQQYDSNFRELEEEENQVRRTPALILQLLHAASGNLQPLLPQPRLHICPVSFGQMLSQL